MMDTTDASGAAGLEAVRAQAGAASVLALVASVVLIFTAVAAYVFAPAMEYLRSLRAEPALGPFWIIEVIARHLVLAIPLFLFADALAALRKALDEYAAGRFFSETAGRAVKRAGEIGLVAMVFKIVASPTIFGWIENRGGPLKFDFAIYDLGVIAFVLFIGAVGRVLVAAAAIKAENDQII